MPAYWCYLNSITKLKITSIFVLTQKWIWIILHLFLFLIYFKIVIFVNCSNFLSKNPTFSELLYHKEKVRIRLDGCVQSEIWEQIEFFIHAVLNIRLKLADVQYLTANQRRQKLINDNYDKREEEVFLRKSAR